MSGRKLGMKVTQQQNHRELTGKKIQRKETFSLKQDIWMHNKSFKKCLSSLSPSRIKRMIFTICIMGELQNSVFSVSTLILQSERKLLQYCQSTPFLPIRYHRQIAKFIKGMFCLTEATSNFMKTIQCSTISAYSFEFTELSGLSWKDLQLLFLKQYPILSITVSVCSLFTEESFMFHFKQTGTFFRNTITAFRSGINGSRLIK